jgi:hypothetical protein
MTRCVGPSTASSAAGGRTGGDDLRTGAQATLPAVELARIGRAVALDQLGGDRGGQCLDLHAFVTRAHGLALRVHDEAVDVEVAAGDGQGFGDGVQDAGGLAERLVDAAEAHARQLRFEAVVVGIAGDVLEGQRHQEVGFTGEHFDHRGAEHVARVDLCRLDKGESHDSVSFRVSAVPERESFGLAVRGLRGLRLARDASRIREHRTLGPWATGEARFRAGFLPIRSA